MWTKEQLQAINEQGKNIIISAGAGSGKTAVLTERILRHVKEGVDLNQLLVLTFTNAAAKEMKERIRKKLIENNLEKHLDKLEQAYITTFDAYSLAICKKYFYKLNISPNISVMSNTVASQKKRQIIEEVLDEYYESEDELFFDYLKKFTTKDDNNLVNLIFDLINKISLKSNKDDYINNYINTYYDNKYLENLAKSFEKLLVKNVGQLIENCHYLISNLEDSKLRNQLEELVILESSLIDFETIKETFINFKMGSLPKNSSEDAKTLKDSISKNLSDMKENYLIYTDKLDMINQIKESKEYSKFLLEVVNKSYNELDKFKSKTNAYEFIDIAKMAIKLVTDFLDVRSELKDNLHEILIDEYQDTSDLQEVFISKIENNNLYMVGDIKQSIYRFRNANPYIFKEKYDKYSKGIGGIKIDLNKNFRSREEVVNNINLTFENIMTSEYGDADFLKEHKMNYGNISYDTAKDNKDYNLQVLTYEDLEDSLKKYSKAEKESFIIVKDIKEKLKGKTFDKGKLRDTKYSDFAILVDKTTNFYTIKKILESNGIPVSINADMSIKESSLNKIIVNIFSILDLVNKKHINKDYFYYFTSLARSFLFEYDDTNIYKIVKEKSIDNEIYEKVKKISKLINSKSNVDIYQIILEEFDIYNKLSLIGDVYNSLVQLEFLNDTIKNLSDLGYTFSNLSLHLKEILESKEDIKYPLKTTSKDSVTIMTIHKSKGLEFSICYFPLLSSKFNLSDMTGDFVYSNKYEIITPLYDMGSKKHIIHLLNKEDTLQKEISEKIRLFYVALTRAKEQIVLIYEDKEYSLELKEPNNFKSFAHMIFSLKDHLDKYITPVDLLNIGLSKEYLFKTSDKKYSSKNNKLDFKKTNFVVKEMKKLDISKKTNTILDKKIIDNIKLGLDFHKYLEYIDFKNPNIDTLEASDFIKDKLKNVLSLDIFKNIKDAKIFKEYEFISSIDSKKIHGIIDLMLMYDTHIDIIDYKLSNIEDESYIRQLNIYKEYIFLKSNKKVNIYLLSILNEDVKQLD